MMRPLTLVILLGFLYAEDTTIRTFMNDVGNNRIIFVVNTSDLIDIANIDKITRSELLLIGERLKSSYLPKIFPKHMQSRVDSVRIESCGTEMLGDGAIHFIVYDYTLMGQSPKLVVPILGNGSVPNYTLSEIKSLDVKDE